MLISPTRFLSEFFSRVLCCPCRAGHMDADDLGGPPMGFLITHLRATDVAFGLRRIPVGFYVAVELGNVTKRTSNKPAHVGMEVVEWDEGIELPSDRSLRISLTVFASFELGPILGSGEVLRKFETTVGELLDQSEQLRAIKLVVQMDGDAISSCSSLEIMVKRRDVGLNAAAAMPGLSQSEEMPQLAELTDRGHRALTRYRQLQEQRGLDESISYFEQARDLCPLDHPSRATVLFNLANAKLMYCRVNDVSPNFDVPIDLYRAVLPLRLRGHPDHAFTLLSLGIALKARFQRHRDEADGAEAQTLLSEILDVSQPNSYPYQAAVVALGSAAMSELVQEMENPKTIGSDLGDDGKVQRLDAALQWIFYPGSSSHALFDHVGILFCYRFDHLGGLADLEKVISMLEAVIQFTSDNHPDKPSWLNTLGDFLFARYMHSGDFVDLERSISRREEAVRSTPDSHPDKPLWLNNLGSLLLTRYEHIGDIANLGKSVSMLEDAVVLTPDEDPNKPSRLSNLGNLLLTRFERFEDLADLKKSISVLEDAVQSTPDGHPDKPSWLNNFGRSLLTRYERFGDIQDLEKSISLREEVVKLTPDGHPDKPVQLNNLGNSHLARYERFGDIEDLEKSILKFEDAAKSTPDGDLNKLLWLNNLGYSSLSRYERLGDVDDLEKSISVREEVVESAPDGHPSKTLWLNNLGHSMLIRYKDFEEVMDLEKAILMFENAVQFAPDNDPDKPVWLNNLGDSLLTRYQRFGDVADLEKSVSTMEDAVGSTPDGHPDKPLRLNNLGHSLLTRHRRSNDVDLEKLVSIFEDAVQGTPDDHPVKPLQLNDLGNSLLARYEDSGDTVDLEKSISTLEDAVKLTPNDHPVRPSRLNALGNSLLTRYERFGDLADLERSISVREDVVKLASDDHSEKPLWLNNLGNALLIRYGRFGGIADLEKSILMREEAIQFTPDDHPDKFLWLNNLGNSLLTRYERFGAIADLDRSISMLEDVIQITPNDHANMPSWLNNLGHLLSMRYERLKNVADLEKSISMREGLVRSTPDGRPDKPIWLINLSHSLSIRYERLGDAADLEKSISMKEDAVRSTPDRHPYKPLCLSSFGDSLLARYERLGDVADLEKAISMLQDALQLTPDGHPDKCLRLTTLALSFLWRFQRDSLDSDLSQAVSYSSNAAFSHTGSTPDRFRASQVWIQCAHLLQNDSQSLLDAYTAAVELLPHLAWIGLSLPDRYHQLLSAADEACDAAAAALEAHKPELAVEWLEQGRSIVWSQHSQLRTPVDAIRTPYPELAAQFERVSHELEHASARNRTTVNESTSDPKMMDDLLQRQAQQHHELALSREKLLAEIRAKPGCERFLLPKTINQLSPLACSGPVVFLNASKLRCDALVVKAGSENVVHVPLSNTSYDEVKDMQLQLNKLLNLKGRVASRDDLERGARLKGMGLNEVFESVLQELWVKVVSPILEVLALSAPGPKLSRIFWCPTGPFTFLPIHAAGIYDRAKPGPRLSDFAVSSYIPTMSAPELPPQEASEVTPRIVRLLAVRQPSTDGQIRLRGVPEEMEIIKELTSVSSSVALQEADGTVEDVVAKMAETDWVHFACHGTQDRTSPFDTGLFLAHCKRLKLSDIVQLSRPRGGLAFLSACRTATGDEQLSEEAIHIAAGMLLAGYRGVIATMWSIMDNDAPRVAGDVYRSLFAGGKVPDSREAAEALHHAIERLRDSGASFLSWVPFIHVGL